MHNSVEHHTVDDDEDYDEIHQPYQLTLEEKDELLFALMDHLKLRVMRAKFDPSFTILVSKE